MSSEDKQELRSLAQAVLNRIIVLQEECKILRHEAKSLTK